jgi:TM2 domain-containing membrane protein YozV
MLVNGSSSHRATILKDRVRSAVCYCWWVVMDFDEFEQLVLKVLFETDVPVTAAHVAYLGRVSVRTAERHLARMVEHGTLHVRTSTAGVVEYVYPGRKPLVPPISAGDAYVLTLRPKPNPVTAVMLSMLIPGAGHIYAGRAGAGVAWMATTLMGYACCFLPGLFLHGLCLVSAAQTRQS